MSRPDATGGAEAGEARRPRVGRAGRRTRDHQEPRAAGAAYITRRIPTFDVLGEEALVSVETAAETILQEIGQEPVGPQVTLAELMRQLLGSATPLPVIHEDGSYMGVITAKSALRKLSQGAKHG